MLCIIVRGGQEYIVRLGKMINIQSFSSKYLVVSNILCTFVVTKMKHLFPLNLFLREMDAPRVASHYKQLKAIKDEKTF